MDTKKDNFTTILIIAVLSLAIFYLFRPSSSNFTNARKVNNAVNPRNNIRRKAPVKEHLAMVDDPSMQPSGGNDLPGNPIPPPEYARPVPPSVTDSANLNKEFPTGQFRPLLLTPSGEVLGASPDNQSAGFGADYTLGVDQNLANPSGRQMQTSSDLRPQEMNSGWFNSPYDRGAQLEIENGNLLASASSQAKIGIDTVGQSLRNASYDIRGSVPTPKFDVGPFNNSTIEYDYNIKALY
jgi:hypothetical protein